MNIHEHQAKELLRQYKIPTPSGYVAFTTEEAIKVSKKLPNFIDENIINELMDQPDIRTEKGLRDRAMLELFYSTGMRLSELINLNIGSIDEKNNNSK